MDIKTFDNIFLGIVINRPSKICKSPYVADVRIIQGPSNPKIQDYTVHTPSLGCHNLIARGNHVLMTKKENPKGICKYTIVAYYDEYGTIVGTHPLHSNNFWKITLEKSLISEMRDIVDIRSEIKVEGMKSRFDFGGKRGDSNVIMEVKSAPLGSYNLLDTRKYCCDVGSKRDLKRLSFFPDGYRKKKGDVVSPRALKQVKELMELTLNGYECFVIYIVNRNDTGAFVINPHDPIYNQCVKDSLECGVKIKIYEYEYSYNPESHRLCVKFNGEKEYLPTK